MAGIKILWTATAKKQRSEIFKYWNKRTGNTKYSRKIRQHAAFRLQQISNFQKAGKETDFPNTRVTAIGHFSIFYRIGNDAIIVMAFWDNRNDPDLIKILLGGE